MVTSLQNISNYKQKGYDKEVSSTRSLSLFSTTSALIDLNIEKKIVFKLMVVAVDGFAVLYHKIKITPNKEGSL